MKRTDTITKLVGLLLFLAIAAYFGLSLWTQATQTVVTAELGEYRAQRTESVRGLILRQEVCLTSDTGNAAAAVEDGQQVAAGSAVALAYTSQRALELEDQIRALELELELARTGQEIAGMDPAQRAEARQTAVTDLCRSVYANGDADRESAGATLRALLTDGSQTATEQEIADMESRLVSLRAASANATTAIVAPCAGVYTSYVDGWEYMTPALLEGLLPSALADMLQGGRPVEQSCAGKLVSDYNWYFAAALSAQAAEALSTGDSLTLDFGAYLDSPVPVTVYSIGDTEGESAVVVFRAGTALAETLTLRTPEVQVVYQTYSGLYAPESAIHTDAGGSYLYAVTGIQAKKVYVDILYRGDGFVLLSGEGLKEGREIVIRARDLADGTVIR